VRSFRLGQRLEPIGNFAKTFVSGALGHAGVHVRVFVCFARDRRLQIQRGRADRQSGGRVAHRLQVLQMTVCMACLTFGSGTEHSGHVIEALDVRLGREVQITSIRLRFACKCVLQILFRLTTL
jgi:hypothetical protein